MTTVDLQSVILERIAAAESALATIDARGPAAIHALSVEGPGAAAQLTAHLAEATRYSRQVIALQRSMAEALGTPAAVRVAASTVATDVSAASRALAAAATPKALKATDAASWDSAAREGYAAAVSRWSTASRIPQLGDEVERGLLALSAAVDEHGAGLARSADTTLVAILQLVAAMASWETLLRGITSVVTEMSTTAGSLAGLQLRTATATGAAEQSLRAAVAAARV